MTSHPIKPEGEMTAEEHDYLTSLLRRERLRGPQKGTWRLFDGPFRESDLLCPLSARMPM
jgi:hypothetical protein